MSRSFYVDSLISRILLARLSSSTRDRTSHPHWHALSRSDERHCAHLPVPEDRHLLCLSAVRNLAYPLSPRRNPSVEGTVFLRRWCGFLSEDSTPTEHSVSAPGTRTPAHKLQRHWPSEVSLSVSRWVRACASYKPVTPYDEPLDYLTIYRIQNYFFTHLSLFCLTFIDFIFEWSWWCFARLLLKYQKYILIYILTWF